MTFGMRLRTLRQCRSLTQEDLAQVLEISKSAVSMYELNQREPNFKTMLRIADFFSVDLDYLYCRTEIPVSSGDSPATKVAVRIACLYDRASETDRFLVRKILQQYEGVPLAPGNRVIPLFSVPDYAGLVLPELGEDYEEYEVPCSSQADFAARLGCDSLEPYIPMGGIILVCRQSVGIGDIGIFYINGRLELRQYSQDSGGNVILYNVNRKYEAEDLTLDAAAARLLCCFGKVLTEASVPQPQ